MIFMIPLIILQMECASQKKQTYEITNSMRSIAPQTMQASPTPIMPVYAKDSPVIPYQGRQAPIGTIPVQISPPNTESKHNTKQSSTKGSMELEALLEKEKDGAIINGKTGDGGDGVGSGSVPSGGIGNRNSGGGGIDSRDSINGGSSIGGKGGKGDNEFNECPDLTPDILKHILDDNY